jgi:C1A family cysteine protease
VTKFVPLGLGWHPDLPDARDDTPWHDAVQTLLRRLRPAARKGLPREVDLRRDEECEYFGPSEDQGPLNCSCACAALSLVEYFERRGRGHTFEGSRLFLYKVARNRAQTLLRVVGDTGAGLRTTFKAIARFGVPPEEHWPYDVRRFNDEPSAFLYSLAARFPGMRYVRLDSPNRDGSATLQAVKSFLAAGFPVAFGFPVPTSMTSDGNVPYRPNLDSVRGGQAVVAVGYSDRHVGPAKQALLIRSSWGVAWGEGGYGWLPAAYVQQQLARDFWTVVSPEWLDAEEFGRPVLVDLSATGAT